MDLADTFSIHEFAIIRRESECNATAHAGSKHAEARFDKIRVISSKQLRKGVDVRMAIYLSMYCINNTEKSPYSIKLHATRTESRILPSYHMFTDTERHVNAVVRLMMGTYGQRVSDKIRHVKSTRIDGICCIEQGYNGAKHGS